MGSREWVALCRAGLAVLLSATFASVPTRSAFSQSWKYPRDVSFDDTFDGRKIKQFFFPFLYLV